jgi:hypothetical protein
MDDQRIGEIAEKTFWEIEGHIYANRDTLAKMVIGVALREALSAEIETFYARVNARAEADMLNGGPLAGAHCRALQAEIAVYRNEKVT